MGGSETSASERGRELDDVPGDLEGCKGMSTSSDELGGLSIFELSGGRSDGRASCRALTPSLVALCGGRRAPDALDVVVLQGEAQAVELDGAGAADA